MERVYISGKMRYMDEDESKRLFKEAEHHLLGQGYDVYNPWVDDEKYKECSGWGDFIIYDLKVLKGCDGIYMLKNWRDSLGATMEKTFAEGCGLKIMFEE